MTSDTLALLDSLEALQVAVVNQTEVTTWVVGGIGVLIVIGVWIATWPVRGRL